VGAVWHFARRGERERAWTEPDAARRMSVEVHRRFLRRFVPDGARVLEVGAGAGRFTPELAAAGCRVVVTERSATRLAVHERALHATPAERCVIRREVLDLAGPIPYPAGEFDAVLAYEAPLPHTRDGAAETLRGLLRVVGRDGVVVASVTSLLGSWRHTPPTLALPAAPRDPVPRTGYRCGRYRWSDVIALVGAAGGKILHGSASNWASVGDSEALARLEADPQRWQHFLDHEVAACAEPGARDGGTHILFATRPA
jgi:SAM-dependent methyltransferase